MGPGTHRVTRTAALVVLVSAALVATSAAHQARTAGHKTPSCSSISRSKMAQLAQTGHLKLTHHNGPLCQFNGHHPGHYVPQLVLEIVPYSKKLWKQAKADAKKSAAKNGSQFREKGSNEFDVTGKYTDQGDSPCTKSQGKPGHGQSKYAPVCTPEPNAVHYAAYARGTDSRTGGKLMVNVGVVAEQGDVHLSHILKLAPEIVSGMIH